MIRTVTVLMCFWFSGCTNIDIKRNDINLSGNNLSVKIRNTGRIHQAQSRSFYGLFRLVDATSTNNKTGRYGRAAHGIVRPAYPNRKDRHNTYRVERRQVALATLVDGVLEFELPHLDSPNPCYTVVSMGSFSMPVGNQKRVSFIDLSLLHKQTQTRKEIARLGNIAKKNTIALQKTQSNIQKSEYRLQKNRAYDGQACVLPATLPLPKRPPEAYSYYQAEEIAYQSIIQHVGLKVGCHILKGIKKRSLKRFIKQYKCGDQHYLKCIRRGEWSGILDLAETALLNCSPEKRDICLSLYALSVITRAVAQKEDIIQRIHAPYRTWLARINKIKSEPKVTLQSCESDLYLVSNKNRLLEKARKRVDDSESALKKHTASFKALSTLRGEELMCKGDYSKYLNTNSRAVFVAPRR